MLQASTILYMHMCQIENLFLSLLKIRTYLLRFKIGTQYSLLLWLKRM